MIYDEKITKTLLKSARFKREYVLNIISVILTLIINSLLIYAGFNLRNNPALAETISNYTNINYELFEYLNIFNSYAAIILPIFVCVSICYHNVSYTVKAGFKNFTIDVMPDKKSYEMYEKYCKLLDIKTPILFINNSIYDSSVFGVKIRGKKAIGISSRAYVDILRRNDYHAFNYQVTSTLGSIYLGHYDLLFQLLTFWARLIPFYNKLYSRALSYSTDRVAQILMGTTPLITSIARDTSGIDLFDDKTSEELLNKKGLKITLAQNRIAMLSGIRNEYPLPYFRIIRILENDEKDKEFINSMSSQNNY